MSKQRSYNTFRQMFPEFVYESFCYDLQDDGLHLSFLFRLNDKISFEPTAFIPSRPFLHPERLSKATLDTLVFHMGMIELISYWKCVCPPRVTVKPYSLTAEQVAFWKKLYYNGLGEFFYTNNIVASEEDFMTLRGVGSAPAPNLDKENLFSGSDEGIHIVPIGGGKDSVVTLEILREAEHPLPMIMNPRGATVGCIEKAGYSLDDVIVVKRTIHPRLLELNKNGCLNGHTPFSAMLAFYTLLVSTLTGTRPHVALSNENSANESTVVGTSVNHQYSKSLEFEDDFRRYVATYISKEFDYYSFLRPLSELQIAMLFARNERYFDVFKSCNVGSKTDIWCGHCAKCLFAYIILSPFISPTRLNAIFGKNMLDDSTMQLEFDQLHGLADTKPFECVGTVAEVNAALSMTLKRWYRDADMLPALLRDFEAKPVTMSLSEFCDDNNLPKADAHLLKTTLQSAVEQFSEARDSKAFFRSEQFEALLAGKRILIAGYGREGKSTHALLRRLFPGQQFDVAHNDEEIVENLKDNTYDLIVKSPGIPSFRFEGLCDLGRITSQADLFLQVYGDLTIGVTGTKGKSTTANLIYAVMKEARGEQHVVLAGNMGIPLFDIVDSLSADTQVVAELSCHQLEIIHRAPHCSVLLNLFQEHLDHYHGYADYQRAKMQIALRQRVGDVCYYCSDNADLVAQVAEYKPQILSDLQPYGMAAARADALMQQVKLSLIGEHNFLNAYVVSLAARHCGASDEAIIRGLNGFQGLEHRLERVATVNGVTFYNDSISTIPQTTIAAVEALQRVDTLILGGFSRGIDYTPLAHYLTTPSGLGARIGAVALLGSAGKEIKEALDKMATTPSDRQYYCHFDADYDMMQAVRFAMERSDKGSICLLSPAASSYDHYKNFEARGAHYKQCVNSLME